MKVRNGFVSNSSSSSFIMGIAIITQKDLLKNWLEDNSIDKEEINIEKYSEINSWSITKQDSKVQIQSFNYDFVEIDINDIVKDESMGFSEKARVLLSESSDPYIMWFDSTGCEPNYDEETGEYDYDVDLSYFSDSLVKIYEGIKNNSIPGIISGQASFGAGRDG